MYQCMKCINLKMVTKPFSGFYESVEPQMEKVLNCGLLQTQPKSLHQLIKKRFC